MLDRPVLKNIGIASLFLSLGLSTAPAYASVKQVGFQWVSPYDGSGNAQLSNVQIPPPPSSAPVGQVMPQTMQNPEVISPVIIDGSRMAPTPYSGQYNSAPPVIVSAGQPPNTLPSAPSPTQQVVVSGNGAPNSGAVADMPGGNVPVVGGAPIITGTPITNGPPPPGSPIVDTTPNYTGSVISTSPAVPVAMPPVAPLSAAMGNDVVQGFANQVPLAVALRQLLPPGYGFSVDQNVDLGTLVSFRGGRPWRETLRNAIDPAGLTMVEQGQMVTIARTGGPVLSTTGSIVNNGTSNNAMAPLPPQPMQPMSMDTNPSHMLQPPINVEPVVIPPSSVLINNTPVMQSWNAERGDTLHKILEDWSRRANVEFEWLAEYDYPMQASYSFNGTFEEAVRSLLTGFEGAHPQPIAQLHTNPNLGQMVLIIETRGNNYSD